MEVHSHTHTERKKWHHYFWEFFMLFLAVLLGFLVENKREHIVEQKRAKVLAASLYADLTADSGSLKNILRFRKDWHAALDTLMNQLEKPIPFQNDTTIFYIAGQILVQRSYFVPTTGTYEQIKQSGYLRYFKQDIAFNLVQYESYLNLLALKLDMENKFVLENIIPLTIKNLNQKYLRNPEWDHFGSTKEEMMPKNHAFQNELYGQVRFLKERSGIYVNTLKDLDSMSGICIAQIKKEYHLK
jgi:hypothetical protein